MAMVASGEPAEGIVIEGADGQSVMSPVALNAIINVAPRFLMEAADVNHRYEFTPAPAELLALISQVADRFLIESADTSRLYLFNPAPQKLLDLIRQVADRIVMEAADANRLYLPDYPAELINDTTAPQISGISVRWLSPTSVAISWLTDEFADSKVSFGADSGVYAEIESDPFYVVEHEIILTGLTEEETYYFVVTSEDQSGNSRQSDEQSFGLLPKTYVYLPVVIR
jgi:hypothetical protein